MEITEQVFHSHFLNLASQIGKVYDGDCLSVTFLGESYEGFPDDITACIEAKFPMYFENNLAGNNHTTIPENQEKSHDIKNSCETIIAFDEGKGFLSTEKRTNDKFVANPNNESKGYVVTKNVERDSYVGKNDVTKKKFDTNKRGKLKGIRGAVIEKHGVVFDKKNAYGKKYVCEKKKVPGKTSAFKRTTVFDKKKVFVEKSSIPMTVEPALNSPPKELVVQEPALCPETVKDALCPINDMSVVDFYENRMASDSLANDVVKVFEITNEFLVQVDENDKNYERLNVGDDRSDDRIVVCNSVKHDMYVARDKIDDRYQSGRNAVDFVNVKSVKYVDVFNSYCYVESDDLVLSFPTPPATSKSYGDGKVHGKDDNGNHDNSLHDIRVDGPEYKVKVTDGHDVVSGGSKPNVGEVYDFDMFIDGDRKIVADDKSDLQAPHQVDVRPCRDNGGPMGGRVCERIDYVSDGCVSKTGDNRDVRKKGSFNTYNWCRPFIGGTEIKDGYDNVGNNSGQVKVKMKNLGVVYKGIVFEGKIDSVYVGANSMKSVDFSDIDFGDMSVVKYEDRLNDQLGICFDFYTFVFPDSRMGWISGLKGDKVNKEEDEYGKGCDQIIPEPQTATELQPELAFSLALKGFTTFLTLLDSVTVFTLVQVYILAPVISSIYVFWWDELTTWKPQKNREMVVLRESVWLVLFKFLIPDLPDLVTVLNTDKCGESEIIDLEIDNDSVGDKLMNNYCDGEEATSFVYLLNVRSPVNDTHGCETDWDNYGLLETIYCDDYYTWSHANCDKVDKVYKGNDHVKRKLKNVGEVKKQIGKYQCCNGVRGFKDDNRSMVFNKAKRVKLKMVTDDQISFVMKKGVKWRKSIKMNGDYVKNSNDQVGKCRDKSRRAKMKRNGEKKVMGIQLGTEKIVESTILHVAKLQGFEINVADTQKVKTTEVMVQTKKTLTSLKGSNEIKVDEILESWAQFNSGLLVSGFECSAKRQSIIRILTGNRNLDKRLGDGVESHRITEVFREFRTEETQIVLTLGVTGQLIVAERGANGISYMGTESSFRPERAGLIAEQYGLDSDEGPENIGYLRTLTHVHHDVVITSAVVIMVSLLIEDFMVLFRVDFSGCGKLELVVQQQALYQTLSIKLVEEFNMLKYSSSTTGVFSCSLFHLGHSPNILHWLWWFALF